MLAWPWRVTSGWLTANTLIRAHDSVLGTHKIRFNATSRSCRRTFDRESPGRQDYAEFRAPTGPASGKVSSVGPSSTTPNARDNRVVGLSGLRGRPVAAEFSSA